MTKLPKLSLRKGREWQVAHGHPWLFSGAISQAGTSEPGSLVDLVDVDGQFIARGYYNPQCDIAVRILSFDPSTDIDREFLKTRIELAYSLRKQSIDTTKTNVFRLINAEGDLLPGFIADYYDGVVVVQSHTAGSDKLMDSFIDALKEVVKPRAIIIRNDASVRKREGVAIEPPRTLFGDIDKELVVRENGLNFVVDPISGQKTGFFTDQRDKRLAIQRYAELLPPDSTLLNCFSYSAGFSIYAKSGNQSIKTINVDESRSALEMAKKNFAANDMDAANHEFFSEDAFAWMESRIAKGQEYQMVILDPPAFAKSAKDKSKATKAYKRMNKLGMALTQAQGILVTCSCSGSVSLTEFEEALKEAAQESGRAVQLLETFRHGADHPVMAVTPESNYLKVLFCRVL